MNGADAIITGDVRQYNHLLLRYDRFLSRGDEETAAAEKLRNEMDAVWDCLTEEQRESVAGLSSDLNWVHRGLAPRARRKEDVTETDRKAVIESLRNNRWHDLLRHLRRSAAAFPADQVAFWRGSAWMQFGEPALALVFFEKAHELYPENEVYAYHTLDCLNSVDPDGALARALEVIAQAGQRSPLEVVRACDIRLAASQGLDDDRTRPVLEEVARVLERAIASLEERSDDHVRDFLAMASGMAAYCHEQLGNVDKAREFYEMGGAVARDSELANLLVARGIHLYGKQTEESIAHFRQVIEHGSPVIWPYYFLAHHSLVQRLWADCLQACEAALRYSASDPANLSAKAHLLEWVAICQSELGFPAEVVVASFHKALKLAPDNERIRHNLHIFEQVIASTVQALDWRIEDESTVRQIGESRYSHYATAP